MEVEFAHHILRIVQRWRVDVWLPCDPPTAVPEKYITRAGHVVRAHQPTCLVLAPDTNALDIAKCSKSFSSFVDGLQRNSMRTPMKQSVGFRGQIHRMLSSKDNCRDMILSGPMLTAEHIDKGGSRRSRRVRDPICSIERPVADPSVELLSSDVEFSSAPAPPRTYMLPLDNLDLTYDFLASIEIDPLCPWNVHEVIKGKVCVTHTLVEASTIRAIMAYVSSIPMVHPCDGGSIDFLDDPSISGPLYPLDIISPLQSAPQSFIRAFVEGLPQKLTATLTIKFMLQERMTEMSMEVRPLVINASFGTPKALLALPGGTAFWAQNIARPCTNMRGTARIYPTATAKIISPYVVTRLDPPPRGAGSYSLPTSITNLFTAPLIYLLVLAESAVGMLRSWRALMHRLMYWREESWDWQDPAPSVWLWLVESPVVAVLELLVQLFGRFKMVFRSERPGCLLID